MLSSNITRTEFRSQKSGFRIRTKGKGDYLTVVLFVVVLLAPGY